MNKKLLIGFGILVFLFLWALVSIYPDWLSFENLGFSPVFSTMLVSRFGFGLVVWVLLVLIISINLYAAKRINAGSGHIKAFGDEGGYFAQLGISGRALNILLAAFVLILSFIVASKSSYQWDMVLRYLYQQPFGSTDPIFKKDIGFYLFSLPEQDQSGNTGDFILGSNPARFVHIDLDNLDLSLFFNSDLCQGGGENPAGGAPGCPEIHQDRHR